MTTVEVYNGILIDYERDKLLDEQGLALLTRKGFYKKEHEDSPQQTFARAATSYCFGDYELAQRLYDAASQKWFTFASPVLSNAMDIEWPTFSKEEFEEAGEWLEDNVEPDGMPISCFLSYVPDTKEGLVQTRSETAWLSMLGGGIGVYMGNRSPDEKSTGVLSHLRGYDADALSYKQTESRRGSIAAYLDVDHPEIMAFLQMRNPVGGDSNKKCFNLNNAINITDKFMNAVINGEKYELVDPKHGPTGNFLNAQEVWEEILEMRLETGEPYLNFIDTVNRNKPEWITKPTYHISQSNLCVAPETMILTDSGYQVISDLENEFVNVWNGEEWSEVQVRKTGTDKKLIKVLTNSGFELECTPEHKFYVAVRKNGLTKTYEKAAKDLQVGDKLIKCNFPIIEGVLELKYAYDNGFFSGDGCVTKSGKMIYLYGDKRKLIDKFTVPLKRHSVQENFDREMLYSDNLLDKFFVPNSDYTIESKLNWFAGVCDSDGTVARNGKTQSIQVCSINKEFLLDIQMMLQTMGVSSKVTKGRDAGYTELPKNDGTGENGLYWTKESYRLLIGQTGIVTLLELGFKTFRLEITDHRPNRECSQFVKIESVVDEGRYDDTFCFTEPKKHMGVFNGILTGNCNEIHLMTSPKRTAVCCLSSLNLEKYDEWKDTTLVADLIRMLDNVLEYFIRLAPPQLKRAVYSATKERAVGLGRMGLHSLFQSKGLAFESGGFNSAAQLNAMISHEIKQKAIEASKQLADERGEADDVRGSGMRGSALLATAPNASSSNIAGTSASGEPWAANAFVIEGRAGSFLVKNKYLEKVLDKYGINNDSTWNEIVKRDGSCQWIEQLTEDEKLMFKTAREISPVWIIEHTAIAQAETCQGISCNLFHDGTWTAQELSDVHMLAWKKGLKGLYYLRGKKAKVGSGKEQPLNAIQRPEIEYEECVSCQA